jgi:hypothetical protein
MQMSTKKWLILYALGIVGITLLAYVVVGLIFRIPPPLPFGIDKLFTQAFPRTFPVTDTNTDKKSPTLNDISANIKSHVSKSQSPGSITYVIDGNFIDSPGPNNEGIIMGNLFFEGIPKGKFLRVLLGINSGQMYTGIEQAGSNDISYKNMTLAEILPILANKRHVRLEIFYSTSDSSSRQFIQVYDVLSQGYWQLAGSFLVRPQKLTIYAN